MVERLTRVPGIVLKQGDPITPIVLQKVQPLVAVAGAAMLLGELAYPLTAALVGIYAFNANLPWTQWGSWSPSSACSPSSAAAPSSRFLPPTLGSSPPPHSPRSP
jgi:hypothetical protein